MSGRIEGLPKVPESSDSVSAKFVQSSQEVRPVSTQAVKEYLFLIWKQYKSASKAEKSLLISEVVRNLRMHRKAVIRLLNSPWAPHTKRGSKSEVVRRERYSLAAKEHLCELWHKLGYMCGVRMKAALPEWLPFY